MDHEAKAEGAFDLLKRDILNGTHGQGQPLRLSALSVRYGVGASPLRKALSRLADIQLVAPTANSGWQVAPVTLAEFEDLSHARMSIEAILLQDAIDTGTLEWEANLVAAHYRLAQAVLPLGGANTLAYRQTWLAVHDGFHFALLSGAQSDWLKRFHAQSLVPLQRYHQAVWCKLGSMTEAQEPLLADAFSVPRHTELMVAALDRDKRAASAALSGHNDVAKAIFRRVMVPDNSLH